MKQYHIYVFTQDTCPPCQRLKEHVSTLSEAEQAELKENERLRQRILELEQERDILKKALAIFSRKTDL